MNAHHTLQNGVVGGFEVVADWGRAFTSTRASVVTDREDNIVSPSQGFKVHHQVFGGALALLLSEARTTFHASICRLLVLSSKMRLRLGVSVLFDFLLQQIRTTLRENDQDGVVFRIQNFAAIAVPPAAGDWARLAESDFECTILESLHVGGGHVFKDSGDVKNSEAIGLITAPLDTVDPLDLTISLLVKNADANPLETSTAGEARLGAAVGARLFFFWVVSEGSKAQFSQFGCVLVREA